MYLTETHQITKKDNRWNEIDNICFMSKNLYNCCLYEIRQYYLTNNTFITDKGYITSKASLYNILKNSVDFRNGMATRPMKSVFKQVETIFKSYFAAIKSYKENPSKFNGRPKLPYYKHKKDGRNIISFTHEAISFKKKGYAKLSMTNIEVKTRKKKGDVKEIRLVPTNLGFYKIEVVYNTIVSPKIVSDNFFGIDLGINNFVSLASNDPNIKSVIINGRAIKSINAFYNKLLAKKKSQLPKNVYTSKLIKHITKRRNNKISDHIHKISKSIIQYTIMNSISEIVIGYNEGWKNKINIGKRNNQNFVSIPYYKFISTLRYKCDLYGIAFTDREESYTSKCSFLDLEDIKKHDIYVGNRVKRGMFKSKNFSINSDINGALNILRKEKGNDVFLYNRNRSDSIRVFAVSPVKVNVSLRGTLRLTK